MALPCRCSVLSDWIHLQWVLCLKRASPISAMKGSDALFPNDFGENCYYISILIVNQTNGKSSQPPLYEYNYRLWQYGPQSVMVVSLLLGLETATCIWAMGVHSVLCHLLLSLIFLCA